MASMDITHIKQQVGQVQWFQDYEIVPGVRTNGKGDMAQRLPYFAIPERLQGKRVLDIGCNDGYFTFLAEERGADVVAIDSWPRRGFFLAHELRASTVQFHHISVYDLHPDTLGTFDIVFYFGVNYHLKSPVWALERIASVTRECCFIESAIEPNPAFRDKSLSLFYVNDQLDQDPSNWWVPTVPCLLQTVHAAGFPQVELVNIYDQRRAVVRATKGPRTRAAVLTEDFYMVVDSPTAHQTVSDTITIAGWTTSQSSPQDGIDEVIVYLDRLDDPACELGSAEYGRHRADLARPFGEAYTASGFQFIWTTVDVSPGPHTLYIAAFGKRGWNYRAVPVMVGTKRAKARGWNRFLGRQ